MRDDSFFLRPEAYTGVYRNDTMQLGKKVSSPTSTPREIADSKYWTAINRSFVAMQCPSLLRDDTRKSVAKRLL